MRRWLQTITELAVAALLHVAILTAVGLGAGERTRAAGIAKKEEENGERRVLLVRRTGPGHAAESGRFSEEIPGFPVPVAPEEAKQGHAVLLPAVAPEQVRNAPDGDRSTRQKAPADVPRPELAQTEPQFARAASGGPDWQLPGPRTQPLQIFPSPLPGPTPGQPAAQRLPPSGGSPRHAKLAVRGFEAAPPPASRAPAEASPSSPSPATGAKDARANAEPGAAPDREPSPPPVVDLASPPVSTPVPEGPEEAPRARESEQDPREVAVKTEAPDPAVAPPPATTAEEQRPSRIVPRAAEEPSPPDPKELPAVAEAPRSEQPGPHAPRPDRNPEDRPAAEDVPGGADSRQPVLLALAPPTARSALEGAAVRLDLPGDERLEPARRALASAIELLELAALEGGEVGERRAAEAAVALAAAEEALRGMEAPEPNRTSAPPQAGAATDLPEGGGLGDEPGSPRLGGNGLLDALAQGRVDHVVRLIGPTIARQAGRGGTGKVDFRVDERGYVREVAIRSSTGDAVLDREIAPTLHLAEPFAATPGWISVVVRFEANR